MLLLWGHPEVIYWVSFCWPSWLCSFTFSSLLHILLILVSPLPSLRSTCTFAATAAQMNSATLFESSSLCPFMPLTHGSVFCSSPMTSTMFTSAQCGTAMKVKRGQTENGGGGKSLPWENFCFWLGTFRSITVTYWDKVLQCASLHDHVLLSVWKSQSDRMLWVRKDLERSS